MKEQPRWLERAKDTYRFHRSKLISNDKWTVIQTSKSLKRSLGSVCEDLLIARWSKTHGKKLEEFSYAYEALKFIRNKQDELDLDEIE